MPFEYLFPPVTPRADIRDVLQSRLVLQTCRVVSRRHDQTGLSKDENNISLHSPHRFSSDSVATHPRPFDAPLYTVSMISIISCLSSIGQLILLLLPVPRSIIMCCFAEERKYSTCVSSRCLSRMFQQQQGSKLEES